jgi:hypothetical protein
VEDFSTERGAANPQQKRQNVTDVILSVHKGLAIQHGNSVIGMYGCRVKLNVSPGRLEKKLRGRRCFD